MPFHADYTTTDLHIPGYRQNSDPGAIGAGKEWLDTSTSPPTLKRRNTANTGWDTPLAGGGPPTGSAGGDLTGTYPNPTVNIDGKTGKSTPVDADETILADSAASFATKKLTWANIKATLKTYFDTLYQAVGTYLTAANNLSDVASAVTARGNLKVYTYNDAGNSSTALTVNWTNGHTQKVTLTGNCTFTFSNPVQGETYVLHLFQDGTGSRTVTWPAAVKWASGTAPTLTTTASKMDMIVFSYDGTNYYGVVSGQSY